jgi:hypothetical protein
MYQDATARAGQIVDGQIIETPVGRFKLRINRIKQVLESSTNLDVFTVSPLVEGENLNDMLTKGRISQEEFNQIESQLDRISSGLIVQLPFQGLHIIPWNVSLVRGKEIDEAVVTDICRRVKEFGLRK